MEKLKKRWGLTSNMQVIIVFTVFAITGSTSAYVSKPILAFIGFHRSEINPFLYWPLYFVLIMPVYKVLLITIGTLFGQRIFFVGFVKKMLSRMGFSFMFAKQQSVQQEKVQSK